MSIATQELKVTDDYLASLQSLFENEQATLEWLVIAHNDPAMIHRLSEVVSGESAAMLQISQSLWDFKADALIETLKWSLSEAGVKHVLLVGHSQGGPPKEVANWIGDGFGIGDPTNSTSSSYRRLLNGAKRVEDEIKRAKHHFVEQIEDLCEVEAVQDAIVEGRLKLHTLFYMSQSGTFMVFDLVNQNFRMIGE